MPEGVGGNLGVDALQEFSVITTNPTAQAGRTSGGVISAVTRAGTNAFHGSVYEFFRDSALDTRNYNDTVKPPFRNVLAAKPPSLALSSTSRRCID